MALAPLVRGAIVLESVVLRDGELVLPRRPWPSAGTRRPGGGAPGGPPLRIDALEAEGVTVTIGSASGRAGTVGRIDRLTWSAAEGAAVLHLVGDLDGHVLGLAARAGPAPDGPHRSLDLDLTLGALSGKADARFEAGQGPLPTALSVTVSGPEAGPLLRALGLWSPGAGPLDLELALRPDDHGAAFSLRGVVGTLSGSARGRAKGTGKARELAAHLQVSGPRLADVVRTYPPAFPPLPPGPFVLSGRLHAGAGSLRLEDAQLSAPGTSLRARLIADRTGDRIRAEALRIEYRGLHLEGSIETPWSDPGRTGAFDLRAAGPGLGTLLPEHAALPAPEALDSLRASGAWSPEQVTLHERAVLLAAGRGTIKGAGALVRHRRPHLSAVVFADTLDLTGLGTRSFRPKADAPQIRLSTRSPIDVDLAVRIDALRIDPHPDRIRVDLDGQLRDGRVEVHQARLEPCEGILLTTLAADEDAEGLHAVLRLEGEGLQIPWPEPAPPPADRPSYVVQADLEATGSTVDALMHSARGALLMSGGPGRAPRHAGPWARLLFEDVLSRTLGGVMPGDETGDEVAQECLALYLTVGDGQVAGDPGLGIQTREARLLGSGTIEVPSGDLDVVVLSRPRRGLGISVDDLLNPFLRVGGTLADPRIVADAERGVRESALGFATGGVWPLLRKLRERFLDRKPCDLVLANAAPAAGPAP